MAPFLLVLLCLLHQCTLSKKQHNNYYMLQQRINCEIMIFIIEAGYIKHLKNTLTVLSEATLHLLHFLCILESLSYIRPVDDIPDSLDIVWTDVLVLQVVGVFPNINTQQGNKTCVCVCVCVWPQVYSTTINNCCNT